MRRRTAFVALFVLGTVLSGCGSSRGASDGGRELTVFAAASLTDAFAKIGADFERVNPGVTVRFSFGPSDGLAAQILEGSPADVFASASPSYVDQVAAQEPGVSHRAIFARNHLVVITPADDPAGIGSLEDVARPGVTLVLAAEGVPAGDYARQILAHAGIADAALSNVVSNEEDVKGVVQKMLLGEADAGIVYATDVTPEVASQVRVVPISDDVNVIATYPIAVLNGSAETGLAARFVGYILGSGQEVLRGDGFLPPG
jgi:molybdate transport system substrate-binding protein